MGQYFTNDNSIPSKLVKTRAVVLNNSFIFYTDNGVFSKGELDFGTELLLKNFKYDNPNNKTLLDIGCGCGPIGIYASHLGFTVDMSDVNKRAIHLSKMSLKEQGLNANVFESDAYKNITNKYDYIVSNPPIRVGKEKLYEIVMNAKEHLKDVISIRYTNKEHIEMIALNDTIYFDLTDYLREFEEKEELPWKWIK